MNKKHIWAIVIAVLLLFALSRIDREALFYSIRQIPLWLIAFMLVLQIVTQLLVNFQWYKIAGLSGVSISYRDIFYANSHGAVWDSITPGVKFGGEVARAVKIREISNCSGEESAALVALQKLFSISSMFFILIFVVGHIAGLFLLVLFLLIFFAVFFIPDRLSGYVKKAPDFSWLRKVKGFFIVLLNQSAGIGRKDWVMLFLLSLLIWILYPVKMYILTLQFYPGANVFHVFAITFAAYIVAMIPVFPGGLGGFEGTMSGLLAATGLAVSDAVVITGFFRFATFWFVLLFGLVIVAVRRCCCSLESESL